MVRAPSIDDVRRISYFAPLSDDEAHRFLSEVVVKRYGAREIIISQGDTSPGLFVLRSGKARIFRVGPDGREQTFRLVSPGDTFGEVPVLDGQPNPAGVETLEASEVMLFPTAAFIRLLERQPAVALAVIRHIARRLRSFTDLVEQISLQTVQGRLARYLYLLAREEGVKVDEGIVVPRQITQQDLASLVGSVREVVSRTLKVMEDDGVVDVRRKDILIRDINALQSYL